jgi:hypothetical protein
MATPYDDEMLKYYYAFKNKQCNRYLHRSHEANFYYCPGDKENPQDLTDAELFLLMPAGEDAQHTWYYVFIRDEEANACWTVEKGKQNKLVDRDFTGDDFQKFAFVPVADDRSYYYILCKGTNHNLFKSHDLMDGHEAIRQKDLHTDDRHRFSLQTRGDVNIPKTEEDPVTNPDDVPTPPAPKEYGDEPSFPERCLIGETLIPFFNVHEDPTSVGPDLVKYQIKNHPYYLYRREQQWRYSSENWKNIPAGERRTETWRWTTGIAESTGKTMQSKTSFTVGAEKGTKATLGLEGLSAESWQSFKVGWEHSLVVTVSENVELWTEKEYEYSVTHEPGQNTTIVVWELTDIWTIVYDPVLSAEFPVETGLLLPKMYPESSVELDNLARSIKAGHLWPG